MCSRTSLIMRLPIVFCLSVIASCLHAQPAPPVHLRTDLLEQTDKVWKNGILTNYSLAQADKEKFDGEYAVIRSYQPYFSWIIADTASNAFQAAYRILIASSPGQLVAGKADIWDSGKIMGRQSMGISAPPNVLQADKIYYWTVQTWNQAGSESGFSPAKAFRTDKQLKVYEPPFAPLLKTRQQPESIRQIAQGHIFYDFAKDAFAQLELKVTSKTSGDTLWIHFGEAKTSHGTVDKKPLGSLRYQRIPLVVMQGSHDYSVQFAADKRNTGSKAIMMPDYIGEVYPFRYVELETQSEAIKVEQLSRLVVNYAFDDDAVTFNSSDTTLNQIWDLCKYSIKATTFSGYYVDGDRERIPYEADALINQLSHYATDTEYNMAKRSLDYLIYHATWPTEWSLQNLQIAWYDYLYSGDIRMVSSLYPELKAKLLTELSRADGLISTRTGKQNDAFKKAIHFDTFDGKSTLVDIVDWPQQGVLGLEKKQAGETDGFVFKDYNSVVNAFHYQALIYMSKLGKVLGHNQDAEQYQALAQKVKSAFQKTFIDPTTGLVVDGEGTDHASLHANMMALAFDLVPAKNHQKVLSHIRSRGMACSVYGSQFLLDGLYNANEADYALSLMNSEGERSWYNMIRTGSTITTEAWDTKYKPNQDWNHAWGAAPANIIVRKLMGIEPLEAGYETVRIKPQPGNLQAAALKLATLRGDIHASIENKTGHFTLKIGLPANTSGVVYLPKGSSKDTVRQNGTVVKASDEGEFYRITDVGPGKHRFEVINKGK
jgi:alpha-L-rhamnosidase